MMSNPYLYEKLAQAHQEYLLCEARHEQMVTQLPEPDCSQHVLAARPAPFLRALRAALLSLMPYQ